MKNIKTILLSGSALLLLAACGTEQTAEESTPTNTVEPAEQVEETQETTGNNETTEETIEEESSRGIENREFEVTLDDAVQLFLDTFPETEGIHHVEFDVDDGRFEYEIDGFNADMEFELTVDAETGEVLEQKSESDDDMETGINFDNIISPQEAMAIALEDADTGYAREWELDIEDGRTEYEIDIEGAEDREIDAETGEVTGR